MKQYWQHRIGNGWPFSKDLFDAGFLTVGWKKCTSGFDALREAARTEKWSDFKEIFLKCDAEWRRDYSLAHFLRMKPGDIVVVPLYDGKFAIAEILSEANIIDNLKNESGVPDVPYSLEDIGFYIKIKPITNKERIFADDLLQMRMMSYWTTLNIADMMESVEKAIISASPYNFGDSILNDLVPNVLESFKKLKSDSFERVVYAYMKSIGASFVEIPPKNDPQKISIKVPENEIKPDADVLAYFRDLAIVICIQVKKHEGVSGSEAVEQIAKYIEMMEYKHSTDKDKIKAIGWAITSGDSFSNDAKKLADDKGIRLINGYEFASLLLNTGLAHLPGIFEGK